MRKIICAVFSVLMSFTLFSQQHYSIIPQPNRIDYGDGEYVFGYDILISYDAELRNEIRLMRNWLCDDFAINPLPLENREKANIFVKLDKTVLPENKEGYVVDVTKEGITVKANSSAGIICGIQTLRQIINPKDGYFTVPVGTITDAPAFRWRAFMLDESRYFKGKEVVLNLLDQMAHLKMNVFHWHLADDQGWRIEIKKYPKLTEIGSRRDSSEVYHFGSNIFDGKPHAGFYTQKEIKEIINYASERNITIVPEIEMPGHSSSAIAAYPWLGTSGKEIKVPCSFGVKYDVYNVADPRVITFLEDVLEEVIALFPSQVIHIGGDEVKYDQWKDSPAVQQYMKDHQLNTPAELQVYFTNNISNWISKKGKKMMGWNEITGAKLHEYQSKTDTGMDQKLAQGTIVHFWKGDPELINQTIESGYEIVNSYHVYTYLDYDYSSIPLKKAYSFNPVPTDLTGEKKNLVLGLGCQMWGEFIPDVKSMNKKIFPRIAAYAETGWSRTENKNYDNFLQSLNYFLRKWEKQGIEYGPVKGL